jgi:plastocyanin
MRVPAKRAGVLAAVATVLIPAAAAQAKPKTVVMGLSGKTLNEFNTKYGSDVNAFFPAKVTIRKGQKVRFKPGGFHTIDFPGGKKGAPLPLLAPAGLTSGVNDANGAPFWFNGQANIQFNPAVAAVDNFGKSFKKGGKRIESGLPVAAAPKPITIRFAKKGTYTYFCDVHPGMVGKVVVKGRHARIPSAKKDKKAVKKQLAAARKAAKKLSSTNPAGNNVSVGGSAKGGVEFFGMLPAVKTVPHGTTVTFSMSTRSRDVHTATFGPGNPETEPMSYLGVIAGSFAGPVPLDQRGVYPSEQPGTAPASLSPALHGNGFWSTGGMDRSNATPLPASGQVTFNTPGTYDFYCMIHPFMHGQVKVT